MNKLHASGVSGARERVDGSIFDLERTFGCLINGKPARMDVAPISGLARIRASDGSESAVFNWSVAERVMKRQGGRFVTRERDDLRFAFNNPVANALSVLGVA